MKKLWLILGLCTLLLASTAQATTYLQNNFTDINLQGATNAQNFTNHSGISDYGSRVFLQPANRTLYVNGKPGTAWGHVFINLTANGYRPLNVTAGTLTYNISIHFNQSMNSAACNGFDFWIQNETTTGNGEAASLGNALGYDFGAQQLKLWRCTGSSSRVEIGTLVYTAPRERSVHFRIRIDSSGRIEIYADGNQTTLFNVTDSTYINNNSRAQYLTFTGGINDNNATQSLYTKYSNLTIYQGLGPATAQPAGSLFATDRMDKANITHWNLTAYNTTNISFFSTTNGTISPNLTGNYTFNFTRGDYIIFSRNINMTNESVNLTPYQAVMQLNATEIFSNITLSNANNFTVLTQSAIGPDNTLFVRSGIINVTFRRTGYHQKTCQFNVTALSNQTYQCTNVGTSALNITARGVISGAALQNYTITIKNNTNSYNYTTENGTIELPAINGTYNLTLTSPDAYTLTQNNYLIENFSQSLEFTTTGANVTIIVVEKVTGNNVSGGNITTLNFTTQNRTFTLDAGPQNISINRSPYLFTSQEFNITGGTNQTITFNSLVTGQVNITVQGSNGSSANDFNITITFINNTLTFNEFDSTANGSIIAGLINGTYNYTLESPGYETRTGNFTLNTSILQLNLTLFSANSIGFTFRDEQTNALIDYANITVELISDVLSLNGSTQNGTLTLQLLQPTNYTMRYYTLIPPYDYPTKYFDFELLPQSHGSLTLYLLNETATSNVTVEVLDTTGQPVQGALVQVLRYQLGPNSYVGTESVMTDVDGKNTIHVQKDSEFYKFIIVKDGFVKLETSPSPISSDTITFQINLADTGAANFFKYLNLTQSLVFNEDTLNFRFTYSDTSFITDQLCLNVEKVVLNGDNTVINKTCLTTKTGTILIGVTNETDATYLATATATIGTDDAFLSSLSYQFKQPSPFGNLGLFFVLVLMLVFGLVGFFKPTVALVLFPIPLVFASIAGLIEIPWPIALVIQSMAILLAYYLGDRA